jgi:prepilin-type N-terminal cleavage/methylation domain-containing protein
MNKKAFSLIELSIVILIIGILVAGVTQSSRIIYELKLKSAESQSQASPVNSVKDLYLWLNLTSLNPVTSANNGDNPEDQDTISSLNDSNTQSSAKFNATQSTDSLRPKFVKRGINGLPSLEFDGTDDRLSITNLFTQSFSLFAVIKTDVAGSCCEGYYGRPIFWGDAQTNGRDGIPLSIGGSRARTFNGSPDSTLGGTTNVSDNNPHIIFVSRDINNGARSIYVDGNLDASDNNGATGVVLNDVATILLGGNTIDNMFFDGLIGEIIVFDRVLKTEERISIEAYLSKKWGVEI